MPLFAHIILRLVASIDFPVVVLPVPDRFRWRREMRSGGSIFLAAPARRSFAQGFQRVRRRVWLAASDFPMRAPRHRDTRKRLRGSGAGSKRQFFLQAARSGAFAPMEGTPVASARSSASEFRATSASVKCNFGIRAFPEQEIGTSASSPLVRMMRSTSRRPLLAGDEIGEHLGG